MKKHLELLVSQKFLTKNQYLQIMMEGAAKVGHPEKFCFFEKWLTEEELLSILHLEVEKGLSFKVAATQCGVWNELLEKRYHEYETSIIRYIQKALSQETGISLKIIAAAFKQLESVTHQDDVPVESFIAPPAPEIQNLELEVQFEDIEAVMASDFSETFDDARYRSIEGTLLLLEKQTQEGLEITLLEEEMRNLYRDLHTIKGSSRFIYAQLIEKIIHASEDLLGFSQKFLKQIEKSDLEKVFSFLLEAAEIAWKIREILIVNLSEKSFWDNSSSKEQYLSVYKKMIEFKKSLDSKAYQIDLADIESMF